MSATAYGATTERRGLDGSMKTFVSRLDFTIIVVMICFAAISTLTINSATAGTRYEGLHINNLVMYALLFVPTSVA